MKTVFSDFDENRLQLWCWHDEESSICVNEGTPNIKKAVISFLLMLLGFHAEKQRDLSFKMAPAPYPHLRPLPYFRDNAFRIHCLPKGSVSRG